jgi:DNA-binding CsgD family transcriptional regulator
MGAHLAMDEQAVPPAEQLRKTGIAPAGDMRWGAHICLFYETLQDLTEVNADYFRAGLELGELCLWALSDPVTYDTAIEGLRGSIPGFDAHLASGRIELVPGREWYLDDDVFDERKIVTTWHAKADEALVRGFTGLRASGNAFWLKTDKWKYEARLDRSLEGRKILALCTYELRTARAIDLLEAARTHNFSLTRRNGEWEFLETPELAAARRQIARLNSAIEILSRPFPGSEQLTQRERVVLAQLIKGASSKQAARDLGISPRTVEFHRANIMRKLDARNLADLVSRVLQ